MVIFVLEKKRRKYVQLADELHNEKKTDLSLNKDRYKHRKMKNQDVQDEQQYETPKILDSFS